MQDRRPWANLEAPESQRAIFKMHLMVCRECRDYLKAYRASMALTTATMATQEAALPESVPEDLIAAVLAARKV